MKVPIFVTFVVALLSFPVVSPAQTGLNEQAFARHVDDLEAIDEADSLDQINVYRAQVRHLSEDPLSENPISEDPGTLVGRS